jgi:hypothetical protein
MADEQPTYRIKNWDRHFENHDSRRLNHTRWVPFPNKHDGKSYRRLIALPNGCALFGAWVLMVEIASKMPARGVLADEDGPLDSQDLSSMTGVPVEIFDDALKFLTDPKIGWLEAVQKPVEISSIPVVAALEGNSRVGKGTEGNGNTAPQTKPRRPPAPEVDPPFHGEAFIESLQTYKAVRKAARRPLIAESELLLYDDLREWGEADATFALTGAAKAGHLQVLHPDKYRNGHNGNGQTRETQSQRNVRLLRETADLLREDDGSDDYAEPRSVGASHA